METFIIVVSITSTNIASTRAASTVFLSMSTPPVVKYKGVISAGRSLPHSVYCRKKLT
ncbi:MAG TPA: hypothetical protein PLC35_05030 [Methanosarcina vacuolata]|nr:hypothetical protein [Methanosarcina vacuolata]